MTKPAPKIHIPHGVNENGVVENIKDAKDRATVAIPIILDAMAQTLSEIACCMQWIEKVAIAYAKRESLLDPADIDEYEKEVQGEDDED